MGTGLRPDTAAAARLRRAGAGAFFRAPGAFPATVRRAQHAGVRAEYPGTDFPLAALAGDPSAAQAAGGDEPEESAAPQARGVFAGRTGRRPLPDRAGRTR